MRCMFARPLCCMRMLCNYQHSSTQHRFHRACCPRYTSFLHIHRNICSESLWAHVPVENRIQKGLFSNTSKWFWKLTGWQMALHTSRCFLIIGLPFVSKAHTAFSHTSSVGHVSSIFFNIFFPATVAMQLFGGGPLWDLRGRRERMWSIPFCCRHVR